MCRQTRTSRKTLIQTVHAARTTAGIAAAVTGVLWHGSTAGRIVVAGGGGTAAGDVVAAAAVVCVVLAAGIVVVVLLVLLFDVLCVWKFVVLLPLHSTILKPYFDLSFA